LVFYLNLLIFNHSRIHNIIFFSTFWRPLFHHLAPDFGQFFLAFGLAFVCTYLNLVLELIYGRGALH
jgi:hypothetical protein